jgi:hypothetical protein
MWTLIVKYGWVSKGLIGDMSLCQNIYLCNCSENTAKNSLKHVQQNCHTAKVTGPFHQSQHLDRCAIWSNMVNCYPHPVTEWFLLHVLVLVHNVCYRSSRLMQAFYAIKLLCLRETTEEITDSTSVLMQEWHRPSHSPSKQSQQIFTFKRT